jgi:hypothetical protein
VAVFVPREQEDGGRLISGRTRKNASRAARIFRLAAYSLARSQTALGAFYRRLKARLGPAKALTAMAHKLAKIVYHMLRYGKAYVDRGAAYYEQQYRERVLKNLQRRAKQMGFELVPVSSTSVAHWPRRRPPRRTHPGGYLPINSQRGLLFVKPLRLPLEFLGRGSWDTAHCLWDVLKRTPAPKCRLFFLSALNVGPLMAAL